MNNKIAFTLSEVLITLSILGVVAAISIPQKYQRYTEKTTVVKVKKIFNALSEAFNIAEIENGPVYTWDKSSATSVFNIIKPYLQIKKDCGLYDNSCFSSSIKNLNNGTLGLNITDTTRYKILLKDGSSLSIWSAGNYICRSMTTRCIVLFFDINGPSKPNKAGVDIFSMYITPKAGISTSNSLNFLSDSPISDYINQCKYKGTSNLNGLVCIYWLFYKNNMDYLHRDISSEFQILLQNLRNNY